jgi:translation initiation factor IF-3
MNDRIRAREVRLVDPDGNQLGIKLLPEALAIARSMDLDLVEVAPLADPPVCRIMDYGKYKFDEAQRAKESRRKASNVGIKEMKYRPKIGQGDFDTKTRQVAKFLADGHKVKVTIMFRGREVFHPELGKRILDKIAESVGETARVESEARLDGRNMVMVLAPDKRARQAQAARHAQATANGVASDGRAPAAGDPAGAGTPPARAPRSAGPAGGPGRTMLAGDSRPVADGAAASPAAPGGSAGAGPVGNSSRAGSGGGSGGVRSSRATGDVAGAPSTPASGAPAGAGSTATAAATTEERVRDADRER